MKRAFIFCQYLSLGSRAFHIVTTADSQATFRTGAASGRQTPAAAPLTTSSPSTAPLLRRSAASRFICAAKSSPLPAAPNLGLIRARGQGEEGQRVRAGGKCWVVSK